jgi:hypothetical protein
MRPFALLASAVFERPSRGGAPPKGVIALGESPALFLFAGLDGSGNPPNRTSGL